MGIFIFFLISWKSLQSWIVECDVSCGFFTYGLYYDEGSLILTVCDMCLGVVLRVHWDSWMCKCFSLTLGRFWSFTSFYPLLSFLPAVLILTMVSHRSLGLCLSFSFCPSDWIIRVTTLPSSSLIPFSTMSNLLSPPILGFSVIVLFSSRIFIWFFCIISTCWYSLFSETSLLYFPLVL